MMKGLKRLKKYSVIYEEELYGYFETDLSSPFLDQTYFNCVK